MIFGNKEIVRSVQRKNVPFGYVGGWVDYRVPENVYFGSTQEEADRLAEQEFSRKAQSYADEHADIMPVVWYNDKVCGEFTKDDCLSERGTVETVCVNEGEFISYVSKEDANAKAMEKLNRIGQAEANANGACCEDWASQPLSGEFYKKDCPPGMRGKTPVVYSLAAGAEKSFISQIDADEKARARFLKEGQEKANAEGDCATIYYNESVSAWFEKVCVFGYKAKKMKYSIEAGRFWSLESVADANIMAMEALQKEGQEYADMYGECEKWIENIDDVTSSGDGCYW